MNKFLHFIKSANLFGIGAIAVAALLMAAFKPEAKRATVTRGVLAEDSERYQITAGEAGNHNCGLNSDACTITFDNAVNVPYSEGGLMYVDKEPGITRNGQGPYTPVP